MTAPPGNLGVGLITFGDPLNESLPVGVLAIGGGCGNASTHVINGQVFNPVHARPGRAEEQHDASLEGYRTAPNITRILEHEVGHGHRPEAISDTG